MLVGLALLRRGRVRSATTLGLGAMWAEIHYTLIVLGPSDWPASASALPLVSLGAALLLTPGASLAIGVLTASSLNLSIAASGWLGTSDGFAAPGAGVFGATGVVALVVVHTMSYACLALLGASLRTSQASTRRVRDLIDWCPDALLELGEHGTLVDMNPAAESLLGMTAGSAIGRTADELPLALAPSATHSTKEEESREWSAVIASLAHAASPVEVVALGKIHLEVLARHVTRDDGSQGTLMVLRDITPRRAAEKRAREYQAQLLLSQKQEIVGRLAGGIAHDFNNLLTAVGGYASLLADSTAEEATAIGNDLLELQERGAFLVRRLLAFARYETPRPEGIDLASSLPSMKPLLNRLIGERVKLNIEIAAGSYVWADPAQVEQIVLNLASNARDAMPEGGNLDLRCRPHDNHVELMVIDSGVGMTEEVQARIFEPFFTTKRRGQGTGLGLATVQAIVKAAGGDVQAWSRPGQGARFTVRLPRTTEAPARASAPEPHPGPSVETRLFVAEDDPDVLSYLLRVLRREGYAVKAAGSGDDALALFGAERRAPDLLLTDVMMPGLTGPELAAALTRRWPDLRVLYMSGYSGDQELPGLDAGAELLLKPFTDDALLARIGALLPRAPK